MTSRKYCSEANSSSNKENNRDKTENPKSEKGSPVERCRGERNRQQVGREGDLEEEALDADALYIRRYGREKFGSSNQD